MSSTPRKPTLTYFVFVILCALMAFRDSYAEVMYKAGTQRADPIFAIFIFNILTQLLMLICVPKHIFSGISLQPLPRGKLLWDFLKLNFVTTISFLAYFTAIDTSLGAGFNAIVAYGADPILTAGIGCWLVGEVLDWRFGVTCFISLIGIFLLGVGKQSSPESTWSWGVFLSLLSTLAFAFYVAYMKRLLLKGVKRIPIIFHRLTGITVVLGIWLLLKPQLFKAALIPKLLVLGLVGYTVPVILFVYIVEALRIRNLAALFFLVPVFTNALSALFGLSHLSPLDIFAGTLIGVSVIWYEMTNPSSEG